MAKFEEAYKITLGHEGGYSNNPDDLGGETCKGIARKFHASWAGWAIIDASKDDLNFPKCLYDNAVLDKLTKDFYKINFWDLFAGDDFPSQIIANEVFDTAVNMGIGKSVEFLQTALNALNKHNSLYPDIVVDGKFGTNTLKALVTYLAMDKEDLLYKVLNVLQGARYIDITLKNPTQETFMRGWYSRVNFTKS